MVRIHNLPFYQPRLVAGLRNLRKEMVRELDSGWLHVMDQNHDVPKISSLNVSKRIAEVFRRVFELPAPGEPGTSVIGQIPNG